MGTYLEWIASGFQGPRKVAARIRCAMLPAATFDEKLMSDGAKTQKA